MTDLRHNYVDGEWIASETGDTVTVRNPAAAEEVVDRYASGSEEDAESAIGAATAAQEEWRGLPSSERGAILREAAAILESEVDELATRLVREEGKSIGSATGEVRRAVDILYYYAEKAFDFGGDVKGPSTTRQNLYTRREPMGVAGLITPWNYPVAIPAWKLGPALATGNTVVMNPASLAPGPAHAIVAALDSAGVPSGVVNLVVGPGSTVGEIITTHDDIDTVSFTGSSEVGTRVYTSATGSGKRAQAEMGGKNPALVSETADLSEAVEIVADGAFGVTGQACTATSRAIVHTAVYDEFVEMMTGHASGLTVGPGIEDADVPPQASEAELEKTLEYVTVAQEDGATHEFGGERLDGENHASGHFVSPAVFSDVEPTMRIYREEVFGPVLAITEADSFQNAIELANDTEYGLSASVITNDLAEAHEFIEQSETGVVKVNERTTGADLHVPFGGQKLSSSNTQREQGDAGLEFYTQTKTVYLNY